MRRGEGAREAREAMEGEGDKRTGRGKDRQGKETGLDQIRGEKEAREAREGKEAREAREGGEEGKGGKEAREAREEDRRGEAGESFDQNFKNIFRCNNKKLEMK